MTLSSLTQDHNIPAPPTSTSLKRWLPWARIVLELLELQDGHLSLISRPPVQRSTGLPEGFSLTGDNTLMAGGRAKGAAQVPDSDEEGQSKEVPPLQRKPDRRAVTDFFDRY
jgi:hypothetical protein